MTSPSKDLAETPVGRLTQRGDSLDRELARVLREHHAITAELKRRYPNILWRDTNQIIAEFWSEADE